MNKRVFITIALFLFLFPSILNAQEYSEYNEEQLSLRSSLFNFLKEEGFMPEIDSDGDIKFKYEGLVHYFTISKIDKNPLYIVLFRSFNYPDDFDAQTLTMATKELNLYKGVKVICFDNSFRIGAEMFVRDSEAVKSVFYKLLEIIGDVTSDVVEECEKIGRISSGVSPQAISELPFIVTKLEVANTDENNNIIQDYGTTIWDFKTKYLTPRITIKPFKSSGTYTIYVKLYKDGVLKTGSSSPTGYSYSSKISISGNSSQVITLSGWGSKTAGHWSIGEYRFEIWYGDYCIGSKNFQVK